MRTRMYCGDSRAHECVSAARGWLLVMMNCVSWPLKNPLASPLGKAKHPNLPQRLKPHCLVSFRQERCPKDGCYL